MSGHDHDHHHHDHDHSELSETQLRVRALETVLTEKGYVDPTALDLLMDDIRLKLSATINRRFEKRKQLGLDPDTPYLIDRTTHEERIGDAIEHVDMNGGVRAFLIAGPENECVDEFSGASSGAHVQNG